MFSGTLASRLYRADALTSKTRGRTAPRIQHLRIRAECGCDGHIPRRHALVRATLLPTVLPSLCTALMASSAQADSDDVAEATPILTSSTPPKPNLKSYIGRDYIFQYDAKIFSVLEDPQQNAAPGRRQQTPVLAELLAKNDTAKVTLVESQTAKLKQTFLQVTDISQLGNPQEVLRMLLPATAKVLSMRTAAFPQAPRDTGTVLGVIERPPVTIYRYELVLPSGEHAEVAIGAVLGRTLLLGAAAPEESWASNAPALRAVADSFRILPK